jgi:hypothetical protein
VINDFPPLYLFHCCLEMSGNLKGKLKVHAVKNKKTRFFKKKEK